MTIKTPEQWRQDLSLDDLERKYFLPRGLLTAVLTKESAGDSNAHSGAGASGLFQFMPATANMYNLDPLNPQSAAEGAAKMYANLSKQYDGDLNKMLAAYNWGSGNLAKKGMENAPAETRDYIKKIRGMMSGNAAVRGDYKLAANYARGANSMSMNRYADDIENETDPEKIEEKNTSFLQNMMAENPVVGLFMLIFGMMSGMINDEQATDLMTSFAGQSPERRKEAIDSLPESYRKIFNENRVDAIDGFKQPSGNIDNFNQHLIDGSLEKSAIYPVKNKEDKTITSGFGERDLDNPSASKIHPAFDFRANAGDEVASMFEGKVVAVGGSKSAGIVTIDNGNGTLSTYMHVDATVKVGDTVHAGDTVAKVSAQPDGKYPPHLDVRTQDKESGLYIHPKFYMDFEKMGASYKAGAITDNTTLLIDKKTGATYSQNDINKQGITVANNNVYIEQPVAQADAKPVVVAHEKLKSPPSAEMKVALEQHKSSKPLAFKPDDEFTQFSFLNTLPKLKTSSLALS